jgi:hypothetical protein
MEVRQHYGVLEVSERVGREDGRVRLGSRSDHDGPGSTLVIARIFFFFFVSFF